LKKDEKARGSRVSASLTKVRKNVVGILIGSMGLFIVLGHELSEYLELGSFADLLDHLVQPSLLFCHIMDFLSIPALILIGYFYQKQKHVTANLEQIVEQRTRRLRESESRLANIIAASPDAITVTDLDGNIIECNQATLGMHGFSSKEEVIGRNALELIAEKDHQRAIENMRKTLDQGPVRNLEYSCLAKDGREFPAELSASVVRDALGNPAYFMAITKNISERKWMEADLAHERDLLHALMDNMPDAIYFKDVNSRFTRVNRRVAEWFGLSDPEDAVGKTDFDFYAQELASKFYADEQGIIQSGQPVIAKEEPESHFGAKWVSSTKVPIRDREGRVTGIVGISRDITDFKRMREKLREYSEHLEETVQERTRELRETQERLLKAERLAAIGETAAMVGHDLRNPLQAMSNLLYLGKKMIKEIPSRCRKIVVQTGIEELFVNAAKQIEYMNKIVSDLQDYARPFKPEFVPTSLQELINETLSALAIPQTVKVSIVAPKDFPNIPVDRSMTMRLFTNLLTNALQAMPDGGQLTIRLEQTESSTVISIEDTGIGIPKENLDKIFQPLFTTKSKGAGFGLPICKRIVETHNGSITVETEVGRGSTFTVTIPLTREVSQTA